MVGRGADVNAKSIQCGVPVACAVREGHWETASYLLEVGADRQEAVTMAICSDQADILLKLMAYGIKIPDVAVLGSPARGSWVHIAVANLGTRVLKVFLELGFNANAQNLSGFTPLHFCVYCGNLAAAELLLSHGARADIRDSNGMTALDLAKNGNVPTFSAFSFLPRGCLAHPISTQTMSANHPIELLRFNTCGRVDDGQSTFIGWQA